MANKNSYLLIPGIIFGLLFIAAPLLNVFSSAYSVRFTLLANAGVMLETDGVRIYVDPYDLPDSYANYPADIVLVTHPHGDHYDPSSLDLIKTDSTEFIFPANMSTEVAEYSAIGVNPEDKLSVLGINITAFYMYTLPVPPHDASHPRENNWTSFLIDCVGCTFFHAGDSKDIPEYSQLNGLVDVALLPLGPGCQTMYQMEVVNAINMIEPRYVIGIHYVEPTNDEFASQFTQYFEGTYLNIGYFNSHRF
jgi:L-ascorbate metabolism protein UlaG (beta-lactamase superfamily)